jgi:gas vesicle protein
LENTSDTQSNSITNNVSKTLENTSNKAADSNVKSISRIARVRQFLQSAGKRVVGAAIGAAFGAPSLLKGLADKAIASELNNLSQIQQDMGTAMAKAQENTAYFQFYQQLVQRFGSIVQEETSDASEVIETYADIVNAYRQIPYALANSV